MQADHPSHFSQANRLLYFPVAGDFVLSCDVQLLGWTLLQAKDALLKLSLSGLSVAMLDDADASPFACWLFRSGRQTPVTVVQDDDDDGADFITLYPGAG